MSEESGAPAATSTLTGLQKLALAIATIVSLGGAGLWAYSAVTAAEQPTAQTQPGDSGASGFEPNAFVAGDSGDQDDPRAEQPAAEPSALQAYSPTIFRLGFAFFLGFAIAYTVRTALKILLLVVGSIALVLIALQTAGWITVNWGAMSGGYESAAAWLGGQFESLTAFLRGYIPSGGSAVAGFGIGMMKAR